MYIKTEIVQEKENINYMQHRETQKCTCTEQKLNANELLITNSTIIHIFISPSGSKRNNNMHFRRHNIKILCVCARSKRADKSLGQVRPSYLHVTKRLWWRSGA